MKIATVGVDLAKMNFQIHGVDERDRVAVRQGAHHSSQPDPRAAGRVRDRHLAGH